MRHILISGERGAGKSTLIARLVSAFDGPVYGFCTKRLLEPDAEGLYPIYIHRAATKAEERSYSEANLAGRCDSRLHDRRTAVFDTLGAAYINEARPSGIIVMDELGFMERDALLFQKAVLDALNGDIQVIAAVKARRDVEFLNRVRNSEKADVYDITESNREALYNKLAKLKDLPVDSARSL